MTAEVRQRDYVWNTLGVLFQNAISPLLLVAITRINGIDVSGLFSFASSVAIVLFAFGIWGGRTYQVSDVRREFQHRSYIAARILLAGLMILGAIIFSAANDYAFDKSAVIVVLVVFKAIESVADSIYGVIQVHSGLTSVGKSLFLKAAVGFGLFVVVDVLTHDILLSSLAIVLVNALFVIFYDIRLARKLEDIRPRVRNITSYLKDSTTIIKRTSAVFAVTFLATFSINIPRFFIDKYDSEQIGYFGIIAMPITLVALLMSFILQPNVVHITKLYARKKFREFMKVINSIAAITIGLGAVVVMGTLVAGVPALNWVFGVDFTNHNDELIIMVIGGVANAIVAIYINILTIIRRFKAQFYILLVTNIMLVAACTIVVRDYGMVGGVVLYAVVNILQMTLLTVAYRRIMRGNVAMSRYSVRSN